MQPDKTPAEEDYAATRLMTFLMVYLLGAGCGIIIGLILARIWWECL